jgi:Xaa-Pro aminopeptidase
MVERNMHATLYTDRRRQLGQAVEGAILLPGLGFAPKNYAGNPYPFRQDSHFLYFTGLAIPDVMCLIMPDGQTRLYGNDRTNKEIMWQGPTPCIDALAIGAGIDSAYPLSALETHLSLLQQQKQTVHYLPPYRDSVTRYLSELLHIGIDQVTIGASQVLARAVYKQRAVKDTQEVAAIEKAIAVSAEMYAAADAVIAPGVSESAVMGEMVGVALKAGYSNAFMPIVTRHGEVLHNNDYSNTLQDGDLILIDTGVEAPPLCYGSDITRTKAVNKEMTAAQRDVYDTVLSAQLAAIELAGPGVNNTEVHRLAAVKITEGLTAMGLMKGSVESAVEQGAHRLFFPHGIGHMLGLDSHDMEDITALVRTPDNGDKKPANLRFSDVLLPGYVITVEPGIYFIPPMIDEWQQENRFADYINYDKVAQFRGFGGVRIEDDILITKGGRRVLGPEILK